MSLHRERGPMVVDDLAALPAAPLVVAEGSVLAASAIADRSRALWLIPTPALQRARLAAAARTGVRGRRGAHRRRRGRRPGARAGPPLALSRAR
jgi:hypothetical protein